MGSTTAISVAKAFDDRGRRTSHYNIFRFNRHKIIGTDILPENEIAGSSFCHRCYRVSPASNYEQYCSDINDIVFKEKIDVIIPCSDIEAEVMAGQYISDCYVCVPSTKAAVITCNDKLETYRFFNKLNIPTPRTLPTDNGGKHNSLTLDFPYIVKPRRGVSSRGVYTILNSKERCLIKRIEKPIIQEKLYGEEFTVDVLCDGKRMIACVPRWRIETKDGKSMKAITFRDDRLTEYCKEIVEHLEIKGICCIQGFYTKALTYVLTEINCRPSATLVLTTEAGINMPKLILKLAAGETLEPITDFKIVKIVRYLSEDFYD